MFYVHEQEIAALLAKGRSNLKIFSLFISPITEQQLLEKQEVKMKNENASTNENEDFFSIEVFAHALF